MEKKTIQTKPNIGDAYTMDGSKTNLDALLVQDCRIFLPKLPHVQFWLKTMSLPEVRVNEVNQHTRYVDPNEIGEKVVFQPFSVTFIVDKYMQNWAEIFNWMKRMTANGSVVGEVDDIVLIIGGKDAIKFVGSWPMVLGGLTFDNSEPDAKYMTCSLVINYDYFDYVGQYKQTDSSYK